MSKARTLSAVVLTAFLLMGATGCAYLQSRDNLNKGIAAYKGADYAGAVEYFKKAIEQDPDWLQPQLYLATAYMNQWIPGAQSPENQQLAEQAKAEFQKVLDVEPDNESALAYLAMIAYNEAGGLPDEEKWAKLDEAEKWHYRRVEVNPETADAYYSLGVIAFQRTYPVWQMYRREMGMSDTDPGPLPDEELRQEFIDRQGEVVDKGLENLHKALDVDPEYDDAMVYINLLLRQQADMLDTEEEYTVQIEEADEWLQKSLDIKQIKLERESKAASAGIVQE